MNNKNKRMVPLRYVVTPIVIIFVAVIILSIIAINAPKPAKKTVKLKAPLIEVMSLTPSDVTFVISSQGSIVPRTETKLTSEVSGQVTDVSNKFLVGGFFKKGEVLLTIDDTSYQVSLLRAQSQQQAAQAKLIEEQARAKQAQDEWLLTGRSVDEAPILALRTPQLKMAEAGMLAAEADIKEAKLKLSRTKIIAPYDAMLISKQVDIGQYVTMGTVMATTYAIDYAEVRLPVKHRDITFLALTKNDKKLSGDISANENWQLNQISGEVELFYQLNGSRHHWNAHLVRHEAVVDNKSRVHYLVAQIEDPYHVLTQSSHDEIRIGTFVNAKINGKQLNNIISIPIGAVYSGSTVYLIDEENRLKIQHIDVMRSDSNFIYTTDNIENNHRLILTKLATPIEGMLLRIAGEEQEEVSSNAKLKEKKSQNEEGE
jgi:RND family efflux transporter MFP subunit